MEGVLAKLEEEPSEDLLLNLKQYLGRNGGWVFTTIVVVYVILLMVSTALVSIWLNFWSRSEEPGEGSFYLIYLLASLMNCLLAILMARALHVSNIYFSLHSDMVQRLLYSPLSYFEVVPFAKIISRLSSDLNTCDRIVTTQFFLGVSYLGSIFAYFACIVYVALSYGSFNLIASLAVYLLLLSYFYYRYFSTSRQLTQLQQNSKIPVSSSFTETLLGISTIRAYAAQQQQRAMILKTIHLLGRVSWAAAGVESWVRMVISSITCLYVAVVLALLYNRETNPRYDIFLLFNLLACDDLLQKTNNNFSELLVRLKSLGRCEELASLSVEPGYQTIFSSEENSEDKEGERIMRWEVRAGQINFVNFSTRYKEDLGDVLKGVTLRVRAGERIGIVGRTGSGKSSLLLCLLRMLEASSGHIEIDGRDISTLQLGDLRSSISVILQEHFLFAGTVRQNVDPTHEHSDSDIQRALQHCGLWQILVMRQGLETQVTEGGENLSAGEKQLLNIARTLLNPKQIILVDEATANIDMQSDEAVQRVLQKELQGRTVLTIAHRIGTVLHCDRILVLDSGRIVELGTPKSLLADENSLFFKLYQQSGKTKHDIQS